MRFDHCETLLLAGLAVALVIAAVTDIKRREIDNWLNAAIALAAPLYWLTCGHGWPEALAQLALAGAVLVVLAMVFMTGAMGGGDVKLLAALALWATPEAFVRLVVVMSLAGGAVTLACLLVHRLRRRSEEPAVPYGVAIAAAGLWMLVSPHLPGFGHAGAAW